MTGIVAAPPPLSFDPFNLSSQPDVPLPPPARGPGELPPLPPLPPSGYPPPPPPG